MAMIFFMTFSKVVVIPERISRLPGRQGCGERALVLRTLTAMLTPFRQRGGMQSAKQDNSYTVA
jgi:hypothetical protein